VIHAVGGTLRTKPILRSEVLGPLRALTDETRLQILELLVLNEQMLAQEIIAQVEVGQSTVSRHLQQLVAAGFVIEQRTGDTNKLYRLHAERVDELFALLRQLLSTANATAILSDARRTLPEA
jgi:DNA-binding transcriptional ArsR family regulator